MMAEAFITDALVDGEVDVLPYCRAVIAACPYTHDLTAWELAELTVRHTLGKYINVDTQDRVQGRMLHAMMRQVLGRVWFDHERKDRLVEALTSSDCRLRRNVELTSDLYVCEHAARKSGRFLSVAELEAIPLPGCWGHACFCGYRVSEAAFPQPAAQQNRAGIVLISAEDDDDL